MQRGRAVMTTARLDEIERELRRLHPNLPAGTIRRTTTLAYLGLGAPGLLASVAPSRRIHHVAWLEDAPAAAIAFSIDLDAYLALDVLLELAVMKHDLLELAGLRTCLAIEAPDELYACLENNGLRFTSP